MEDILWKMLGFGFSKKSIPGVALMLRTPDGREKVLTKEGTPLVMIGEPGELVLYHVGPQGSGGRDVRRSARSRRGR